MLLVFMCAPGLRPRYLLTQRMVEGALDVLDHSLTAVSLPSVISEPPTQTKGPMDLHGLASSENDGDDT